METENNSRKQFSYWWPPSCQLAFSSLCLPLLWCLPFFFFSFLAHPEDLGRLHCPHQHYFCHRFFCYHQKELRLHNGIKSDRTDVLWSCYQRRSRSKLLIQFKICVSEETEWTGRKKWAEKEREWKKKRGNHSLTLVDRERPELRRGIPGEEKGKRKENKQTFSYPLTVLSFVHCLLTLFRVLLLLDLIWCAPVIRVLHPIASTHSLSVFLCRMGKSPLSRDF